MIVGAEVPIFVLSSRSHSLVPFSQQTSRVSPTLCKIEGLLPAVCRELCPAEVPTQTQRCEGSRHDGMGQAAGSAGKWWWRRQWVKPGRSAEREGPATSGRVAVKHTCRPLKAPMASQKMRETAQGSGLLKGEEVSNSLTGHYLTAC